MRVSKGTIGKFVLVAVCLAAITVSGVLIYSSQFATPTFNEPLHQEIGRVLANETLKLVGKTGRVVVITLDGSNFRDLNVQFAAFEQALTKAGVKIKENYPLETDGKPKYGVGSGLSGRRYVRIVNKNLRADAIVSFAGVPDLTEEEIKELKKTPKFVAETRNVDELDKLFKAQLIHAAVAPRFTFPAPIQGKPKNARQWFDKHFQVVTAETAKTLLRQGE